MNERSPVFPCPQYSDDGKTLERFPPESPLGIYAVPETVEHIAEDAFYGCRNLKKVILPPKLKVISFNCFEECENLEEVVLPPGLEDIRLGAFCGCKALKSITLPQTMTVVEDHTFSACGLIEVIIPEGVTKICHGAFVQCKKLKRVVLPSTLEIIEEFAFGDCINLEEINLQPGTFLRQDAFDGCDKITIDRDKMIWTGYFPIRECYCFMCEEKLEKVKFLDMPQVDGSFKKVNCVHWYCNHCQAHIFKNFQLERLLKIRKENIYG